MKKIKNLHLYLRHVLKYVYVTFACLIICAPITLCEEIIVLEATVCLSVHKLKKLTIRIRCNWIEMCVTVELNPKSD